MAAELSSSKFALFIAWFPFSLLLSVCISIIYFFTNKVFSEVSMPCSVPTHQKCEFGRLASEVKWRGCMKKMLSLRAEAVVLTWQHLLKVLWPVWQMLCDGTTAPVTVSFHSLRWCHTIILLPRNKKASWVLIQLNGSRNGIFRWKKGQLQCKWSYLNEAMHYWVNDLLVENRTWAKFLIIFERGA